MGYNQHVSPLFSCSCPHSSESPGLRKKPSYYPLIICHIAIEHGQNVDLSIVFCMFTKE